MANKDSCKLSTYGGYKKLSGTKTGFFHVEQLDGRWWIIDPEGHVSISTALNHIEARELLNDYNREKNIKKLGNPGNVEDREGFLKSEFMSNFQKMLNDDYGKMEMNTYGAFTSLDYRPPNTAY